MHACCPCVCSTCLPRHVAIAIDLSDVAACAKKCSSVGAQKQLTQKDRLVAGFIVEDMVPLSTIESPRFRKILDKLPATRKPTSDRKAFSHYLNKCYTDMESKFKIIFESSLDHVYTTADIWSANNKSYLGMTMTG